MHAAVAGVQPAAARARRAVAVGLAPVALQDVVGAGEHLAVGRRAQGDAERRRAGAGQAPVALVVAGGVRPRRARG